MKKLLLFPVSNRLYNFVQNAEQGDTNRTLLKGASSAFTIKVAGAGLNFMTQVFLARILGVQEYGLFAYATSWMILLAIPSRLGLGEAIIRFIPQYEAEKRPDLARGILGFSIGLPFIASLLIVALIAILLYFLKTGFWNKDQVAVLQVMLFVLPIFTLNGIRESALRAFKKIALAFMPEQIFRPIILCICSGLFFYFSGDITARQAWVYNGAAYLTAFAFGTWWLYHVLPQDIRLSPSHKRSAHWLKISSPMLFMGGMNVILSQSGVVLLGFFAAPEEVGIYAVTARLVLLVNFALASVNAIAGPMISQLYYSKQMNELQRMLTRAAQGVFLIAIAATVLFACLGEYILAVFGKGFRSGYGPLLILMCGQLINSLAGSVALVMNMTGHQNNAAKILGFAVVVNLAANLALIPEYGAYGAAIETAAGLITWNGLMFKYVSGKIGLNTTIIGGTSHALR